MVRLHRMERGFTRLRSRKKSILHTRSESVAVSGTTNSASLSPRIQNWPRRNNALELPLPKKQTTQPESPRVGSFAYVKTSCYRNQPSGSSSDGGRGGNSSDGDDNDGADVRPRRQPARSLRESAATRDRLDQKFQARPSSYSWQDTLLSCYLLCSLDHNDPAASNQTQSTNLSCVSLGRYHVISEGQLPVSCNADDDGCTSSDDGDGGIGRSPQVPAERGT